MDNSVCQLLNNLLETQDSELKTSRNPPLLGDALSAEEHVRGCMCDSFQSGLETKQKKELTKFTVAMTGTGELDRMEFFQPLSKKDRSIISFYCV